MKQINCLVNYTNYYTYLLLFTSKDCLQSQYYLINCIKVNMNYLLYIKIEYNLQ